MAAGFVMLAISSAIWMVYASLLLTALGSALAALAGVLASVADVKKVDDYTVKVLFPAAKPFWAEAFVGVTGTLLGTGLGVLVCSNLAAIQRVIERVTGGQVFDSRAFMLTTLPDKVDYTIVDGIKGRGHYVGTYLAHGANGEGWWGEGEIKFFLDGDTQFPTICGTGTEDYFCGSYDFDSTRPDGTVQYTEFTTPYTGLAQVIRGDGHYDVQQRFGMYRWHIMDPIRFQEDLRVTIQALGWRSTPSPTDTRLPSNTLAASIRL